MIAHVICHCHCAVNIFKKMNIDMYIHEIFNNPHAYEIHLLLFFSRQYSKYMQIYVSRLLSADEQ